MKKNVSSVIRHKSFLKYGNFKRKKQLSLIQQCILIHPLRVEKVIFEFLLTFKILPMEIYILIDLLFKLMFPFISSGADKIKRRLCNKSLLCKDIKRRW